MNIENKHRICLPIYTYATKILLLNVPVPCVTFHVHRFSYHTTTRVRELIDPTFCWSTKDAVNHGKYSFSFENHSQWVSSKMYAYSHCENKGKGLLSNHCRILRGLDGCHGAQEERRVGEKHLIDEEHLAGKVAGHTAADHSAYHMMGCNHRCRAEEGIAGVVRAEEDTAVAVREAGGIVGAGAVPEEEGIAATVGLVAGMADGHPALYHRNSVDVVLRERLHSLAGVVLVELHSWADVHRAVRLVREHRSPAGEKGSHKMAAAVYSRHPRAAVSAGRAIRRMDWEADYASMIGYHRMIAVHNFDRQVVLQEEVEGTSYCGLKEGSGESPCAMSRTLPRGQTHE